MSKEPKHSPAPWSWDAPVWSYDPEQEAPWLIDADEKIVLCGEINCGNEANARLIAAAPELLAALQGVLRVADRATDEFDAARAAIVKATGSAS